MASRDRVALLVYVDPQVKAELERRAAAADRSVSAEVRLLLARALETQRSG